MKRADEIANTFEEQAKSRLKANQMKNNKHTNTNINTKIPELNLLDVFKQEDLDFIANIKKLMKK